MQVSVADLKLLCTPISAVAIIVPWELNGQRFTKYGSERSVISCMQELGMTHDLLPLHRLDCGTEGVVVMGKHPVFAKTFGRLMRDSSTAGMQQGCFQKVYLALAAAPADVGVLRHHALINVRAKGLPASTRLLPEPTVGSVQCVLEVIEVSANSELSLLCT